MSARRRSRTPFLVFGAAVAVLLLGGLAAWQSSRAAPDTLATRRITSPKPITKATPRSVRTAASGRGARLQSHAIKTVFVILLENHNWSQIAGSRFAPYINRTLLPRASYATRYYNPPGIHPSLPNYLWLEAGTNFGILDDNPPGQNHQSTRAHLVTLLARAGISWKAYEESIGGTTCPLIDSYPYAVRHDPFVYFDDVTNDLNPRSPSCIGHVRPYAQLATDLKKRTVARYNFITPNVCDDGHDACYPRHDAVNQTDTWLSHAVPLIVSSPAYRSGGALFITWDEGENGSDGPIGMIVVSPDAKGGGYHNAVRYTHSSTLRTIEEIFEVSPLFRGARYARDLRDLFRRFP